MTLLKCDYIVAVNGCQIGNQDEDFTPFHLDSFIDVFISTCRKPLTDIFEVDSLLLGLKRAQGCDVEVLKFATGTSDALILKVTPKNMEKTICVKIHPDFFHDAQINYDYFFDRINQCLSVINIRKSFLIEGLIDSIHGNAIRVVIYDYVEGEPLLSLLEHKKITVEKAKQAIKVCVEDLYHTNGSLLSAFDLTDCIFTRDQTLIITDVNKLGFDRRPLISADCEFDKAISCLEKKLKGFKNYI